MNEQRFIAKDYQIIQNAREHLTGVECSDKEPVEILIRPYAARRSEAQNRMLWGWYYRNLADQLNDAGYAVDDDDGKEWPYTKDLLHQLFAEFYLVKGEIRRKGKVRQLFWSTTELTKGKTNDPSKPSFSEYVEKVKQFASQHWGIELEDPISGAMRSYFDECR